MTDALALERVAAGCWQADETAWLGPWLLRAADGFTGRANSALVLGDPGRPLAAALAEVAAWYRARGLAPCICVPLPVHRDVERAATDAGWEPRHGAHVMVRPLDGLGAGDGAGRVAIAATPSDGWLATYRYRGDDLPPAARRVLVRGDEVGFAEVRHGDAVVAVARGAVVADERDGRRWLGVSAVETAPLHRRRGLATAVLGALGAWARERGATEVFLQVEPGNVGAVAMYRRAGFAVHHDYRYLALGG